MANIRTGPVRPSALRLHRTGSAGLRISVMTKKAQRRFHRLEESRLVTIARVGWCEVARDPWQGVTKERNLDRYRWRAAEKYVRRLSRGKLARRRFPQEGRTFKDVPPSPGIYFLAFGRIVLHVGRTENLYRRLGNHLDTGTRVRSSFTHLFLHDRGKLLRDRRCSYSFVQIGNPEIRARAEALALADPRLRPVHLGTGERRHP